MKSVENPSSFIFRPDAASVMPVPQQHRKKSEKSSFFSIFRSQVEEEAEETPQSASGVEEGELVKKLDRIHELGQVLVKKHTLEHVQEYKKAVQYLVKLFVETGLRMEEQVSSRNILNQKKYSIVKVIDEKLERLVTGVLQSQIKQIELLEKLEEIQGLLVNLVH